RRAGSSPNSPRFRSRRRRRRRRIGERVGSSRRCVWSRSSPPPSLLLYRGGATMGFICRCAYRQYSGRCRSPSPSARSLTVKRRDGGGHQRRSSRHRIPASGGEKRPPHRLALGGVSWQDVLMADGHRSLTQRERQEEADRFTTSLAGFAVALVLGLIAL